MKEKSFFKNNKLVQELLRLIFRKIYIAQWGTTWEAADEMESTLNDSNIYNFVTY